MIHTIETISNLNPDFGPLIGGLLQDTRAPQDWDKPIVPQPESNWSTLKQLQDVLQDPKAAEMIAKNHGTEMEVFARGPRIQTPTGDFYGVIGLPDGRLSILLGDAVGHDSLLVWENSIRISLFMRTPQFLEFAYNNGASASDVLSFIDNHCNFRAKRFANDAVTATHVLLDPRSRKMQIANAGNPYPFIIRENNNIEVIKVGGALLSHPEAGVEYHKSNDGNLDTEFHPGDVMVLMSDGVPDGQHVSGKSMHEELPALLRRIAERDLLADESFHAIMQELAGSHDDVTLMTFSVQYSALSIWSLT